MDNKKIWAFHAIFLFLMAGILVGLYLHEKNKFDNEVAKFNRDSKIRENNLKKMELLANKTKQTERIKYVTKTVRSSQDKVLIAKLTSDLDELQSKYNALQKDKSSLKVKVVQKEKITKQPCDCKDKIKYVTKTKVEYKTKIVEKKIPCQNYEVDEIRHLQDDFYSMQNISTSKMKLVCGTNYEGEIAYPAECNRLKEKRAQALLTLQKIEFLASKNNLSKVYESFLLKSKLSLNE
jgi:hypothetical protein